MVYGNQDPKGGEVLIVDDVESNRLILGEIIKSMGHCPVLAEGAREALSIIQKQSAQCTNESCGRRLRSTRSLASV